MFCPHCDKRLTPDHRCLSRRIFLFAGLWSVVAPKVDIAVAPERYKITEFFYRLKDGYLRQVICADRIIGQEFNAGGRVPFLIWYGNPNPPVIRQDRWTSAAEMKQLRETMRRKIESRHPELLTGIL